MRPVLTEETLAEEFTDYYWLKEELQAFCRSQGMSAAGSKGELAERIREFLVSGKRTEPVRTRQQSAVKPSGTEELSLDTVITETHRCTQEVRAFFKAEVSPSFHFSVYIQRYFKENTGKTYRDAAAAWMLEEERKKDPSYRKEIPPQFEYNRFMRDYFADPANKGKSRRDAVSAWNTVKTKPGSNAYLKTAGVHE